MARKVKFKKFSEYASQKYTSETTQTNNAQKVVSSTIPTDNSLSLGWKNKITDIDNKIKKLESTDINLLPTNKRTSAVENIQTQLDTLRSTKKTYEKEYDNALKYGDKLQTWYSLPQKSDFAQKSQYVSTKDNITDEQLKAKGYRKTDDGKSWMKIQGLGVQYYDGGGDKLYEYINDSDSRSTQKTNAIASGQATMGFDSMGYDKLTDEEKGIYNYLYSTDKEQAEEFLKIISPTLQTRTLEEIQSRYEKIGSDNPAIASMISVGTNLKNAAMTPTKVVAAATGAYDENPWLDTYGVQTQAIRQAAGQKAGEAINVNIPLIDKNAGELLYSGAMSLADMGAALAIGGGSSRITQAVMSSSAGSSALSEAKSKGASDGKALILGLGSAFIEAATEKYSIEAIFKKPENAVKFFLENTLTEGVEEGVSNIANVALDTIVSSMDGSKSDIEKDIEDLINKNGISEKEATKQVLLSRLQDLGADVLVGSLSGAAMSAPKSISYQHQENKVNKLAYDTIIRGTDTEAMLNSVVDKSTASKAVKDISKTAFKAALLSSGTTKQSVVETMSERGYMPSMAMLKELKANTKSVELAKTGLSSELASTITQLADKLDTAFTGEWYADNGAVSARNAAELYIKGVALGDAVSAVELASDSLNENFSQNQAEKTIKKAASMLPANIAPDISTGSVSEKAQAVIDAATEYILQIDAQTADVSQNYIGDIVSSINEAMIGVELNQKAKTALSNMLTTGNVADNLNEVLGDESATNVLSKILGAHIDMDSKESYIRRKVVDMLNTYKAGFGNAFSAVAKQNQERVNYFEQKLDKIGANSTVVKGFKNAVLNGKLSEFQAREIAFDPAAFDLYVKATAGRLGANPTLDDMIKAAGYVGGFDFAGDISPYYDKGYSETAESDALVPDGETGVYDAGNGTVVLNKKAEPIKKLSYKLAQELLSDVANEHKTLENVRYSNNEKVIDLSKDNELSKRIGNIKGTKRYRIIENYIIDVLGKESITLSDGKNAIIDNHDAHHLSTRPNDTRVAQISKIKKIVENARLVAEEESTKEKKFDYFYYYEAIVKYENDTFPVYLNVGRARNDGAFHIYDITQKLRDTAHRLNGVGRPVGNALGNDISNNIISEISEKSNDNENLQKNDNTLVNSVINYMSANGYNLESEVNRVIKKFNPYILEHRARLNSSLLSEQSLQREIAADFLTSVFSDEAAMQKLADTNLSLAVELAERVKAFANSTPDQMMQDFANGVFTKMHIHFRTKLNQMKLNSVLSERKNKGLSNDAFIEADNEFFKTIELDSFNFDDMKIEALDTGNAAYRKWVDSGEAFARLGKELGVDDLYATFNSIRQAKARAEVMITKRCVDINGKEVGPALAEIFKTVYENGTAEDFDLYLQYLNNSARYQTGQEIIKGMDTETSLERAAALERKHPEFLKLREKVYKYRDVQLDWRIATGNITQEEADYLRKKNPYYVPAWVITENNGDTPFYADSVVTTKGLKKAVHYAMHYPLMPVFKAMAIQTERMVYETGLNRLFVKIENELESQGKLARDEKSWVVDDPKIFKYIQSIVPVEDKSVHAPRSEHGVYLTPKATNKLTEKIKELLVYDENRSAINVLIRDFAKGVTLNEHYEAQHIDRLMSNLQKLGAEYKDKYLSNMKKIAKMSSVCDIPASKLERTGKKPKEIFTEFFNSIGNVIKTKTLGDVAVPLSSAKSEIRHGITAEKIASIEAIPSVLQNGKIIFKEQKKDTDVERIVVCAPITIGNEAYYMGVMVQRDAQNQRVYLHNVVIEKEMPSLQVDRLTNGTLKENEHLYITNIIQKALTVKKNDYNGALDIDANSIINLCNNAIVDAKAEREEITKAYNENRFKRFDPESEENFSFQADERSGNCFIYYKDGEKRIVTVSRPLYEGAKHLRFVPDANIADKFIKDCNTIFKKMCTSWKSSFALRNAKRDLDTALLYSKDFKGFCKNFPVAYKEIATNGKWFKEFEALGGMGGTRFDYDRYIKLEMNSTKTSDAEKYAKAALLLIPKFNNAIETAPRLAEYISMREKGHSQIEAMYAAQDITVNFGRSGITGKQWNATWVPFFNPAIQGADKFFRCFKENKGRALLVMSLKLLGWGFSAAIINEVISSLVRLWDKDEEEYYEQLTDYQKQNNILIPTGDGKYFMLPKGRENIAISLILEGVYDAITGKDVEWFSVITTAASQVMPSNPLSSNLFSGWLDAMDGKTWYGEDIVNQSLAKKKAELQYDDTTSKIAIKLGELFNYSPKIIDYIVGQYGGDFAKVLKKATTPAGNGNVFESAKTLFIGEFILDSKISNRISSDYYGKLAELYEEKTDFRLSDTFPASAAYNRLNSISEQIDALNSEIIEINSRDISARKKTDESNKIRVEMKALMLKTMAEAEEVYSAADGFESKYAYEKNGAYYNEEGDELTKDAYLEIMYREIYRELFGSEDALQYYNPKTYANAVKAVEDGATFDLYYDAYFDLKSIDGDIDFNKGTIKTGTERYNKWKYINSMDASRSEKSALAKSLLGIDDDKIKKAIAAGISEYDYIDFVCDTGSLKSDDDHTKKQKVLAYINRMSLSSREKDALYILAGYSTKTIYDAPWR